MSQQVNFYAAGEDTVSFHSWLITSFPDMEVVFSDSARHSSVGGVPQPMTPELLGQETVCLVPSWANNKLVYHPAGSLVSLDLFDSPAIEYTPSIVEAADECVTVGRIYWAFTGRIEQPQRRQIDAIMKWVISHTERLLGHGSWRIAPHAKHIRFLRQWVGNPESNPLYTGKSL